MNLVILADDAFTFLLSWESMSLASWALVMAHHARRANARAGYVYIVMASFGTLALLLAFGLLAGPDGDYGLQRDRAPSYVRRVRGTRPRLVLLARRNRRRGSFPWMSGCPRPSGGAEPCFGPDERRHDQGRRLRLHPRRFRSSGADGLVVGRSCARGRRRIGRPRVLYALMEKDLKRSWPIAPSKISASSSSVSVWPWPSRRTALPRQGRWRSPLPCSTS